MANPSDDSKPDFSFLGGDDSAPADGPEFPDDLNFQPSESGDAAPTFDSVDAGNRDEQPDPGSGPSAGEAANAMPAAEEPAAMTPRSEQKKKSRKPAKKRPASRAGNSESATEPAEQQADRAATSDADTVPRSRFNALLGYAAALTLLFLYLLVSGRLSGTHSLESLPDIKPLEPGQFQSVPADAALPRNHELRLGESRRFGDVVITANRVVLAPLDFERMSDQKVVPEMRTRPVLQLQFTVENAATDLGFAPYDVGLMSYRSPEAGEGVDDEVLASSALYVHDSSDEVVRVLNYLHAAESSFDISGQHSSQVLAPGESTSTLIASSDAVGEYTSKAASYRWRIHIRKGINRESRQGVTTLVEVCFSPDEISSGDDA
ncbi:MAG: hypothetical protein NXI04_08315 [Planctomycetaceae bacterium]|nr:hypothetical protein [Planctomycetaceae bacterium]